MASQRKALCVGINQFRNYPASALQGCVNDAKAMSALFQKFLECESSAISLLTDAQATKANIMQALNEMVAGAKAGKYSHLFFSLSSHGTQVPDKNGDESDTADEAFCPHDLAAKGNQWDPKHIILDDELRDLFVKLPAGVLLEVFLDTCHSGTGLRAIDLLLDRKPRYLPPPSLEAFEQVDGKQPRGLREKFLDKGIVHLPHVLWAGCRADQTSADAQIAGDWHGAFTYFFCKEMYACNNQLSRKAVLKKVRADLKAAKFTQIPQLEERATERPAAKE